MCRLLVTSVEFDRGVLRACRNIVRAVGLDCAMLLQGRVRKRAYYEMTYLHTSTEASSICLRRERHAYRAMFEARATGQ